jgi:hypothetical protein
MKVQTDRSLATSCITRLSVCRLGFESNMAIGPGNFILEQVKTITVPHKIVGMFGVRNYIEDNQ